MEFSKAELEKAISLISSTIMTTFRKCYKSMVSYYHEVVNFHCKSMITPVWYNYHN